ncbi:Wzz/FepE/Etk N-terminal domain-containing protein [Nonomuraea dietziae]|uniref:Wzz/FepE/Etk N-terminal domain-containing protein n=1 Tax=Nonomuraea dietziae TaxID=65515 RepID=UPI0033E2153C
MTSMTWTQARVTGWLRRWWLPLSLLLGALAGLFYSLAREPVYSSDAYVVVVAEGDPGRTANFAQAYARIAVQPGLITSGEQAQRTLSASASPDAPLVRLTAIAPTAQEAVARADQASTALISYANMQATNTGVRLASFASASLPLAPSSPALLVNVGIGTAAAVLVAGLVFLASPSAVSGPRTERSSSLVGAEV